MSDRRRVAITGIGMTTSLGVDAAECWAGLVAGRSGIRTIRRFDTTGLVTKFGGELPDRYYEKEAAEFPKRLRNQTSGAARLGFVCATEAIRDSGFTVEGRDPYRCAVISGSGQSGFQDGLTWPVSPEEKYLIVRQMVNAIPAWVSIKYGLKGRSYNVATACASGAFAVGAAYEYIASGRGDAVVVIGVDVMLSRESLYGFNQLLALSERNDDPEGASCPFDRRRSGFVMANGGAAVVLELEAHARRRGAKIYARLAGVGLTSEAYNIVAPEPTGREMGAAMTQALEEAQLPKEAIGYISAHGTSTQLNDLSESLATRLVFGDHARQLGMSSQKSMTGHTIGAAGTIECAVTALTLHHGIMTPTINYREPDPQCDLDYVPNVARAAPGLRAALSNSFGFGGHGASLALEKV